MIQLVDLRGRIAREHMNEVTTHILIVRKGKYVSLFTSSSISLLRLSRSGSSLIKRSRLDRPPISWTFMAFSWTLLGRSVPLTSSMAAGRFRDASMLITQEMMHWRFNCSQSSSRHSQSNSLWEQVNISPAALIAIGKGSEFSLVCIRHKTGSAWQKICVKKFVSRTEITAFIT